VRGDYISGNNPARHNHQDKAEKKNDKTKPKTNKKVKENEWSANRKAAIFVFLLLLLST
jgi:hypothetical protein